MTAPAALAATYPAQMSFKSVHWEAGARTFGQGQISVSYEHLVKIFGKPDPDAGDDFKTDAHWVLEFEDGMIATVYNWKNGPKYGGPDIKWVLEWNVGGFGPEAFDRIVEVLGPACKVVFRYNYLPAKKT